MNTNQGFRTVLAVAVASIYKRFGDWFSARNSSAGKQIPQLATLSLQPSPNRAPRERTHPRMPSPNPAES